MNVSVNSDGAALSLATLIDARHYSGYRTHTPRVGVGSSVGPFRGLKRGQGLDFDDLRPYVDGDDVRHIDWKVTARYNAPHTRLYREEKDNVVTLAVDFRSSMFTGSSELRAVTAGKIAATLLWKTTDSGSRCGVMTLKDTGTQSIRASGGERGALAGCGFIAEQFSEAKALADNTQNSALNPDTSTHSTAPHDGVTHSNLQPLINALIRGGRFIGSVVLISGFDSFDFYAPSSQLNLRLLSRRSQQGLGTCAVRIIDPIEHHGIPVGSYTYTGNNNAVQIHLNKRQTEALRQTLQQHHTNLRQSLKDANIFLRRYGTWIFRVSL